MLKVRKPENPESTINKAKVPIITPTAAIKVMILMVLLLLFENKYRLAMYKEKFKLSLFALVYNVRICNRIFLFAF